MVLPLSFECIIPSDDTICLLIQFIERIFLEKFIYYMYDYTYILKFKERIYKIWKIMMKY